MARVKTALVIGGGIAGPAAALALHKAGIQATVYEAYPADANAAGAWLTVAPNGMNALQVLGVDQDVQRIGQPIRGTVIADGRGRNLLSFDGLAGLPLSQVVARADLCSVLRQRTAAEGIVTEFSKRLVGVDETADGITAQFADGSVATGDVLIGADGIHSVVRTMIDPGAPSPASDGLLGFGGLADVDVAARPDAMYFVFGKRAFFGYWRPTDGRTAWFSNLPYKEPISPTEARSVPAESWLERLRDAYAEDVPARDVLRNTSADDLLVLGPTDMLPPIPHWHRGRMVLVGDAAHAPNHSSGQGASLAVESALELARCLRDVDDHSVAFSTYERLRRPRVTKIAADAARTNNRKAAGPVASALMRMVMPVFMKLAKPEKMFGPAHSYRIDWEANVVPDDGRLPSSNGRSTVDDARIRAA